MTFVFNLTPKLQAIIAHTLKHTGTSKVAYEDKTGEDSLWLVKDMGAYLMTNTTPKLMNPGDKGCVAVYADGMRPQDGHIGGDDFVVNVPLEWFTNAIAQKHTVFILTLTSRSVKFRSK